MAQEIELKLEIDPADIPRLLGIPQFASESSRSVRQLTIYYDTPDAAVKKSGHSLRVREVGGRFTQTVKPLAAQAGLMSREEVEAEVRSAEPDLALLPGHPLAALLDRSSDLVPVVRNEVVRTKAQMSQGDSVIGFDLDQGTVSAGDRTEQFAELELELESGSRSSLVVAARQLADLVPVRLGVLTKAERGLRLASGARAKITKAGPVAVDGQMNVAEAFEIIVHACLRHYRLNEPLVLRKRKAEALHQSRVALRRLRSALSLFKPGIEDVEFEYLRQELRWFTGQLGDARNLDVYLQRELADDERSRLVEERERAYDLVIAAMDSRRTRRMMIDLVGWVAVGPWRRGKLACKPIAGFARQRLDRLWNGIAEEGRHLATVDEETRHELRIKGKKLRYATEFFRELFAAPEAVERQFADAVGELQESLGHLNDIATARSLGAAPKAEDWLIGSYEERHHLKSAEEAYRKLMDAGPYWRTAPLAAGTSPMMARASS